MTDFLKTAFFVGGVLLLTNVTSFHFQLPSVWWEEKDKPLERKAKPAAMMKQSHNGTINEVKAIEIVTNSRAQAQTSTRGIEMNNSIATRANTTYRRVTQNW